MADDLFSDAMRRFQDKFDTRRLADKVADHLFHDQFSDEERQFVEEAMMVFIASVDGAGQPQASYKGGPRGFIKITGPSEMVLPLYKGNGFYHSAGNLAETAKIGLLFIDFEAQKRLRMEGMAEVLDSHPALADVAAAQLAVRITATRIFRNCPRNVHRMQLVEASQYSPKTDAEDVATAPWAEKFHDVLPDDMKPQV